MSERALKIGTRGSDLALEQARRVRDGLIGPGEIEIIRTSGDRFGDQPLGEANQVGFFTKEIEDALLSGRIDLAVHSLKDLPTSLANGLELGAVLTRDDPSDILLARPESHDPGRAIPLKRQARVGASSLRRQALLKKYGDELDPAPIRGNVPTRIEKAVRGEFDAIILSRAGLERLRLDVAPLLAFELNPRVWTCAPGQATIAIEIRAQDREVSERLDSLRDQVTWERVQAERSLLAAYGGGCHVPFGAFADHRETGFELFVAAPAKDRFVVECFHAAHLEEARRSAEAWIRGDRSVISDSEVDEWLSKPARSWC